MSYLTEEGSAESGRPIELFKITMGSEVFRYTSSAEDVTVDGQSWNAIPLQREAIELGAEARGQKFSIVVSGDNQFAQYYVLSAPPDVPILEVFRVHYGDVTDSEQLWEGEIVEIEWVENTAKAKISARPIEGGMDARIPRIDSGVLCPYMLYSTKCGVSRSAFDYAGTAGSVSGNTLTVSGLDGGGRGAGWATAGEIVFGDERRVVLKHTATDTLTLGSAFREDPTSETVTVYAGCDHSLDGAHGCNTKYSNSVNFGGKHYMPSKDIYVRGV